MSQTLVTALQIALIDVLAEWGIKPQCVVGHSSGEIAAAYSGRRLSRAEAIKVAYLRGIASANLINQQSRPLGMLAAGIDSNEARRYLASLGGEVQIACINSPRSMTFSGYVEDLERLHGDLKAAGMFSRMLQVDVAYHSKYMIAAGSQYHQTLKDQCSLPLSVSSDIQMYSSLRGTLLDEPCGAKYWKENMVSPVKFNDAVQHMLDSNDAPDFLVEIGPHNALAGPVSQIMKAIDARPSIQYHGAWKRGEGSVDALFRVAGYLYMSGGEVDMRRVNRDPMDKEEPRVIVDLPTYAWNHTKKYWHENEASQEWRSRKFAYHDLLGSKVLGTAYDAPSWKTIVRLHDLPWLRDHKVC